MTQPDIIQMILKDSSYHLDLFTEDEINALRNNIFIKIDNNPLNWELDEGNLANWDKYEACVELVGAKKRQSRLL